MLAIAVLPEPKTENQEPHNADDLASFQPMEECYLC
jgi:hypothetical protein